METRSIAAAGVSAGRGDRSGATAPSAHDPASQPESGSGHALIREIVERLPDGVIVVSGDGIIRFANPAAERLFGRASSELTGEEFGFPLVPGETTEIELVRRGGGMVVAELRLVGVMWDGEPATLVSLRDITHRRESEERERQLERERAARREAEAENRAKSEFLAVMSHELRTPLNAVLGYAELLDLGIAGALSDAQRQQLGRISGSGRHLLSLVNELLDLAKVEAGRLVVDRTSHSASDVLDAAIVLAQPQAEARGLTLRAPLDAARTLHFCGDRDRTLQILVNLLSNAVKFTEPGGTVSVETLATDEPDAEVVLRGSARWVAFRVTDTGPGIPPEQMETIFAPFVQAESGRTRRKDGTGLGLTISRRLARLMGGDVSVRSVSGDGATFTLWLPESPPDAPRGTEGGAPAAAAESTADRARGLAAVGDLLLRETGVIVDAFTARMRREASMPAGPLLRYSQLADHSSALLADIASAMIALEESGGGPSPLLDDSNDIQRFIGDRHGTQRARLGWTTEAMQREFAILAEEVERGLRRAQAGPSSPHLADALSIVTRYIAQAAESSRRSLERAALAAAADDDASRRGS